MNKNANERLHRSILFLVLPYMLKKAKANKVKSRSYLAFPYGVLSMATYLRKHVEIDLSVEVLDLNLFSQTEIPIVLKEYLRRCKPDFVGISMMFDQSYQYLSEISALVKDWNDETLVLLGGASATTSWDEIIPEQEYLDAICYSEGEAALQKLVTSSSPRQELLNDPWVTRQSLAAKKRPKTTYVDHLNDVIEIDYSIVDTKVYSMKQAFSPFASYRNDDDVRQFFMVTSRGCPFKCVFCAEPALHGSTMRYADIDAIMSHVEHMVGKYGMNVLTFYDDQLLLNTQRAKELFRRLAPFNIRLEAPNGVTLVYIDEEMAGLMRKAGFDTLPLAIESGSDYVLNKIIRKPLKVDKVRPVVERLQRNGIFVQAFFVIGLPGELDEHREETLALIKEADLDWSGFSLASPVRGSALYTICKEKGYIDPNLGIGEIESNKYIIHAPELGLTADRITRQAYHMNLNVNFVNNRQMRLGNYEVAARCFEEVIDRYDEHAFAHYYLAEAYRELGINPQKISDNMERFELLIRQDNDWQEYAQTFGLISSPVPKKLALAFV
jgi:radical SAM superfamily enzyme YgiQ (UPF0313 family)